MKIDRTERFKKDFFRLPDNVRKAASKQISMLLIDHKHPSLRLKSIKGWEGKYSVRVDRRYRIALSFMGEDTILLMRVLDHDELYKSP